MLNNSLTIRLELHTCHKALIYYDKYTDFTSFNMFCEYIHNIIINTNNKLLPNYIKKVIYYIVDEIQLIFGFKELEILEVVINFFQEKLWGEYTPLIIPLKSVYDGL